MDGNGGPRVSRRQLLAGGLAASGVAALAEVSPAFADTPVTDAALLNYALSIEQLAVFVYQRAVALPDATGRARTLLLDFLGHEQDHVAALLGALRTLSQPLAPPVNSVAAANAVLREHGLSKDVGSLRKLEDAIKLLLDIEGLSQGAYYAAAGLLRSPTALLGAAGALGCEAQHQALLTDLLYPGEVMRSVPSAFVEGWQ